jgi:lipid-A-disaccharide synthase
MRIALVAGESSGDLLGAGLIRAILAEVPDACFEGVAGPEMVAAGCEALEPAETLAVMGLIEPLKHLPELLRLRRRLVERWTRNPPDVFVGIDAPDFNLGLEERLKSGQVRTVHYVSPSVWAWRQGRVRKIGRAVDRVLCLLPFEKAFYDEHGIDATFVGHPMADNTPVNMNQEAVKSALGIRVPRVLAILPGSRHSEVSRLGPVFAETAARIAQADAGIGFVAPMATARLRDEFSQHLDNAGIRDRFVLTDGAADQAITASDVVLLASGTATLQAALLGRPMVVAYRLAPLTYAIANGLNLIKVKHIALPNLLTGKPWVPEFIQGDAEPGRLADAVGQLLDDADRREEITAAFRALRTMLAQGADQKAAAAVLELAGA